VNLYDAIETVWADVADCVYRHPNVLEAIAYARDEMTDDEFALLRDDAASEVDDEVRSRFEAYAQLRDATQADVDATLTSFDVNQR